MWNQQTTFSLNKNIRSTSCLRDEQCVKYKNMNIITDKYKVNAIDLKKKLQTFKYQL